MATTFSGSVACPGSGRVVWGSEFAKLGARLLGKKSGVGEEWEEDAKSSVIAALPVFSSLWCWRSSCSTLRVARHNEGSCVRFEEREDV